MKPTPTVAVLVPCCNEAKTITTVVADFRRVLPEATVYVYDNNSSDTTVETAQRAGAVVRSEALQGKGNVVRRMFADVDADIYVLVDGDDTYDAGAAPRMIDAMLGMRLDLVNGLRTSSEAASYRSGHRFGNALLTRIVGILFRQHFDDMLSGYKVLSRRFVKSMPVLSAGFEIETEIIIHALEMRMPTAETRTIYRSRPAGSASKLNTVSDGLRILFTIARLFSTEKPMQFFSSIAALFAGIVLAIPVFGEYLSTGLVPRFPTAILATGLMLTAFLSMTCGVILDSVCRGRREFKRLAYLGFAPPGAGGG